MNAYYNELDPFASAWLRNLVAAGHIATGTVDSRSIHDVRATDVAGARQAHFFAGIGAWSHALRLAGWPDDADVWTGSCPCQPFSSAGKGRAFDDERHLWPEWFRLIRECRPAIIFGEQVASKAGLAWLDVVSADLEGAGYAFGAADLCAASVGAPHIRQRLVFVAYAGGERREGVDALLQRWRSQQDRVEAAWGGAAGALADDDGSRCDAWRGREALQGRAVIGRPSEQSSGRGDDRGLGNAGGPRLAQRERVGGIQPRAMEPSARQGALSASGATGGFWADADWLACTDGKARPVEPGTFPLAHLPPRSVGREQSGVVRLARRARVGRLRGYGNAIVPHMIAEFIRAALEAA